MVKAKQIIKNKDYNNMYHLKKSILIELVGKTL